MQVKIPPARSAMGMPTRAGGRVRVAGDVDMAAEGLDHQVEGGPIAGRAGFTEAGDGNSDDRRLALLQGLMVDLRDGP